MVRQYIDPELLNYASMMVKEQIEKMALKWEFNERSISRIAKMAVTADKTQDEAWLKAEIKKSHKFEYERYISHIAKRDGYYPFIQFRKKSFRVFKELYGEESLSLMQEKLQDPTKIGPAWAAQFVGAVQRIGYEECAKHENLFEFVTSHQAFQDAKEERLKFLRASDSQFRSP